MNSVNKIACILTNYNHQKYINKIINNIFHQTVPFDEVIIIDDGSSDNSFKEFKKYKKKFKFILQKNHSNKGINYSFNKALKIVKSEYIFSMAMDDNYSKKTVEYFKDILRKNNLINPKIVVGDAEGKYLNGKKILQNLNIKSFQALGKEEFFFFYKKKPFTIFGGNTILNTKEVKKFGGYNEKLLWHSDWMLYLLIALNNGIILFNKKIVKRSIRSDSYSSNMKNIKKEKAIIKNFLKILTITGYSIFLKFKKLSILPNYNFILFISLLNDKKFRAYITIDLIKKIFFYSLNDLLGCLFTNEFKKNIKSLFKV